MDDLEVPPWLRKPPIYSCKTSLIRTLIKPPCHPGTEWRNFLSFATCLSCSRFVGEHMPRGRGPFQEEKLKTPDSSGHGQLWRDKFEENSRWNQFQRKEVKMCSLVKTTSVFRFLPLTKNGRHRGKVLHILPFQLSHPQENVPVLCDRCLRNSCSSWVPGDPSENSGHSQQTLADHVWHFAILGFTFQKICAGPKYHPRL